VLAQQIVAIVAVDEWDVPDCINRFPARMPAYRGLPPEAFHAVLELISCWFGTVHLSVLRPARRLGPGERSADLSKRFDSIAAKGIIPDADTVG
jgi:Lhr-like helicase